MTVERAIRVLAGTLVLLSIVLSRWAGEAWLLLAVFVGANLIQSAVTGFCPAETLLRRTGRFAETPPRETAWPIQQSVGTSNGKEE